MAIITVIAAGDVCRMFATRGNAVMARATGADNLRVINSRSRREHGRAVAVLANVGRQNVCRVFANGV